MFEKYVSIARNKSEDGLRCILAGADMDVAAGRHFTLQQTQSSPTPTRGRGLQVIFTMGGVLVDVRVAGKSLTAMCC